MDWAVRGVELEVENFKRADQKVAPLLLLLDLDGETHVVGVDANFLVNTQARLTLTEDVIPGLIHSYNAAAAALIVPIWRVRETQIGLPLEAIERDHGEDGIAITAATSETQTWQLAVLERHEGKTTLSPWTHPDPGSPGNPAGLAMQDALREVRLKDN